MARHARFALLLLLLPLVSCRPELVVRLATQVFHDGSVERVVEVVGTKAGGEEPEEDGWLRDEVGIDLAEAEAWAHVDRGRDRLRAEGFFQRVDELPPILTFTTGGGPRTDRVGTFLDIEDRVVLRRWVYREMHGDPFGSDASNRALDALVDMIVDAIRDELRLQLGADLSTDRVELLLREEGRSLASALLAVNRRASGEERAASRMRLWSEVLQQHGVPAVAVAPDDDYWEQQFPPIAGWTKQRIADALSTPEAAYSADDLDFLPSDVEDATQMEELVARHWGDTDALIEAVGPHVAALSGYFGSSNSPYYRFESRVRLPGTVLATNGAPDEEGARWIFREQDLTFLDTSLRALSVEALSEPLTRLGARRSFSGAELLRLHDLLWKRDPDGVLTRLLQQALDEGALHALRDEGVPDEYTARARELADLLDPEVAPAREL